MKSYYPKIMYNGQNIVDISRYFYIKQLEKKGSDIYFLYTIKDWKSPENIAYDFYDSCDYVWIIFLLNNIINPYDDWLMQDEELKKYIFKKYQNNEYSLHHYEYEGKIFYPNQLIYKIENTQYLFPDKTYFDINNIEECNRESFLSTDKNKILLEKVTKVTNYDYETNENEKKRIIKILHPQLIHDMEDLVKQEF